MLFLYSGANISPRMKEEPTQSNTAKSATAKRIQTLQEGVDIGVVDQHVNAKIQVADICQEINNAQTYTNPITDKGQAIANLIK